MRKFTICMLLLVLSLPAYADAVIASWNIEHLGWNNGKDMESVAEVASHFDLIAVQEVMNEQGVEDLVTALERTTGADWDTLVSHAVGRGTYKEMYAFFYRTDEISWVDGAVVYTDDRNAFAREPFSARFRTSDGYEFVFATLHAIYGDSRAEREKEAIALRSYLDWLDEQFHETPIFLGGDFNLPPTNPAWGPVMEIAEPLITDGNTTISTKDGKFANLYDNIWAPRETALPLHAVGRLEFPHQILGITHKQARDSVSDHIPVWMWLSPNADLVTFPAGPVVRGQQQVEVADPVIGNRNSMIYHLEGCPGFYKTAPRNRIGFQSAEEAVQAGYRAARNC